MASVLQMYTHVYTHTSECPHTTKGTHYKYGLALAFHSAIKAQPTAKVIILQTRKKIQPNVLAYGGTLLQLVARLSRNGLPKLKLHSSHRGNWVCLEGVLSSRSNTPSYQTWSQRQFSGWVMATLWHHFQITQHMLKSIIRIIHAEFLHSYI